MFSQDTTCPDLLDFTTSAVSCTGLSPCIAKLSRIFHYSTNSLRANPLSLAATHRISVDFFSSGYLDVSVPRVRFTTLCIQIVIVTKGDWVSPFGNPRIKACLSAPRGLSQTTTSFIASYCLGIHRMRLVT